MVNNLMASELVDKLTERFPDLQVMPDKWVVKVQVAEHDLIYLMEFLKNDTELSFEILLDITAVDYKEHYMVVYNLFSIKHGHKIMAKCQILHDNPSIITVSDLYPAAEIMECEVYDLMGIEFISHPNLRRILLPDDFAGYPLRKDYKT